MLPLRRIYLEITSHCNMRCQHCCQESYLHKKNDLSFKELILLIRKMRDLGVESVVISGGEPLLRYDLFKILNSFENNAINISAILTNGLLLTQETTSKILRLQKTPTLFISLDGIKPIAMRLRGYSKKRAGQIIDTVLTNVKSVVTTKIPVMINTVVTKYNIDDLIKMYNLLNEIGVRGWRVALPNYVGAYKTNILRFDVPKEKVFEKYLNLIKYHLEIIEHTSNKRFHLQIQYCFRLEVFENFEALTLTDFVCDYEGKRKSCCIKPNGDVVPCSLEFSLVAGNVRQESLRSIWKSKLMQRIKNTRLCDIQICNSCKYLSFCGTGCRANAFFLNNSRTTPDTDACTASRFVAMEIFPLLKEKQILRTNT